MRLWHGPSARSTGGEGSGVFYRYMNVTSTAAADTAWLVAEVAVAHPLRNCRPINSREAFALIDIWHPWRGLNLKCFTMASKRFDRGQFRRLLQFLRYPAVRSRGRTGRQNCCLRQAIGGIGAHPNLVFHEFDHSLFVTDRAEGA